MGKSGKKLAEFGVVAALAAIMSAAATNSCLREAARRRCPVSSAALLRPDLHFLNPH